MEALNKWSHGGANKKNNKDPTKLTTFDDV
jgi:hypothetical protein